MFGWVGVFWLGAGRKTATATAAGRRALTQDFRKLQNLNCCLPRVCGEGSTRRTKLGGGWVANSRLEMEASATITRAGRHLGWDSDSRPGLQLHAAEPKADAAALSGALGPFLQRFLPFYYGELFIYRWPRLASGAVVASPRPQLSCRPARALPDVRRVRSPMADPRIPRSTTPF